MPPKPPLPRGRHINLESKRQKALALLVKDPTMTITEAARRVGCHPAGIHSALNRNKKKTGKRCPICGHSLITHDSIKAVESFLKSQE